LQRHQRLLGVREVADNFANRWRELAHQGRDDNDLVDGMAESDEQSFQVVLASLLDLAALDVDVIDEQLVFPDELVEVEAQGADVLGKFLGSLLEGEEGPRFAEHRRAAKEKLHRQDRLTAAGAAADEGGPAARQAAAGDFVEAGDTGRHLGQALRRCRSVVVGLGHGALLLGVSVLPPTAIAA
jgi:hypothetical protein